GRDGMGACMGASYGLALCEAAPDRVTAAVLQAPIGLSSNNRLGFTATFDDWGAKLRQTNSEVSEEALAGFRQNMFGGDFVFAVSREFVARCQGPLLVLAGNDEFQPRPMAEEIAQLSPCAELVYDWDGPENHEATARLVRRFLTEHTPGR